jgi:60 kDa SS-A/Ro ribonucleoprotein
MANKSLFSTIFPSAPAPADARNEAGGLAYAMSPKHRLAQYAATGCLNSTFYADAQTQLKELIDTASLVEPEFVARVALHVRSKGHMKDVPAVLVAVLGVVSPGLMAEVFDRVIDTPRMLRTFVQVMRSGAVGRRSLGTLPKRLIQRWIERRSDEQVFRASVGNAPSIADVIRMVHPRPSTPARSALLAYMIGKDHDAAALPDLVRRYEAFKVDPRAFGASDVPDVPMDMLTGLALEKRHWKAVARRASWQTLRMNLNTFARHQVFTDQESIEHAARMIRDEAQIRKSKAFPYQLMAAYFHADAGVPDTIRHALHDAMEIAVSNVPRIDGRVWIFPDVSGSMLSPITGHRPGATTAMRCVDVAALVAASIVRHNDRATVLPFSDDAMRVVINPRDSVLTNAKALAGLPGGGTNCSAPLEHLNRRGEVGDLVIYVSDNESWIDSAGRSSGRGTATLEQWRMFKRRNPRAKLVCLDLQPNGTAQAPENDDVLNVGGFGDAVFDVIAEFANNTINPDHWVGMIEKEMI